MAGCFFGKPPFNPFVAEFAVFVFLHIVVLFPPLPALLLPTLSPAGARWRRQSGSRVLSSFLQRKIKKKGLFSFACVTAPFPAVGGKDYVMCSRYFVNGAQPRDSLSLDRRGRQGKEKEKKKKKTTTQ